MSHEPFVALRPLSADNWHACASLTVEEAQREFLPSNVYSIAAAQFYPESACRAVYAGPHLVGFAMYGVEQGSGRIKLFRLMIDAVSQRRGYGRAALTLAVGEIQDRWAPECIYVSYQVENVAARILYQRVGFTEVERVGSKVTARKLLPSPAAVGSAT